MTNAYIPTERGYNTNPVTPSVRSNTGEQSPLTTVAPGAPELINATPPDSTQQQPLENKDNSCCLAIALTHLGPFFAGMALGFEMGNQAHSAVPIICAVFSAVTFGSGIGINCYNSNQAPSVCILNALTPHKTPLVGKSLTHMSTAFFGIALGYLISGCSNISLCKAILITGFVLSLITGVTGTIITHKNSC